MKKGHYDAYASFGTKVFTDKTDKILDLFYEAVSSSHLGDEKRLKEIVAEQCSSLQMQLISAGHSTAVSRGLAYLSEPSRYDEAFSGISYYRFLKELDQNFESHKENLIRVLKFLVENIFVRDRMLAGITCAAADYPVFEKAFTTLAGHLPEKKETEMP